MQRVADTLFGQSRCSDKLTTSSALGRDTVYHARHSSVLKGLQSQHKIGDTRTHAHESTSSVFEQFLQLSPNCECGVVEDTSTSVVTVHTKFVDIRLGRQLAPVVCAGPSDQGL